jgi:hypothetical protein
MVNQLYTVEAVLLASLHFGMAIPAGYQAYHATMRHRSGLVVPKLQLWAAPLLMLGNTIMGIASCDPRSIWTDARFFMSPLFSLNLALMLLIMFIVAHSILVSSYGKNRQEVPAVLNNFLKGFVTFTFFAAIILIPILVIFNRRWLFVIYDILYALELMIGGGFFFYHLIDLYKAVNRLVHVSTHDKKSETGKNTLALRKRLQGFLAVCVLGTLYSAVILVRNLERHLTTDKSVTLSDHPWTPEDTDVFEVNLFYFVDVMLSNTALYFVWVTPSKAKARGHKFAMKRRSTRNMASKPSRDRATDQGTATAQGTATSSQLSTATRQSSQGASSMYQTYSGTKDENINTRAETVMEAFDEDVEAAEV